MDTSIYISPFVLQIHPEHPGESPAPSDPRFPAFVNTTSQILQRMSRSHSPNKAASQRDILCAGRLLRDCGLGYIVVKKEEARGVVRVTDFLPSFQATLLTNLPLLSAHLEIRAYGCFATSSTALIAARARSEVPPFLRFFGNSSSPMIRKISYLCTQIQSSNLASRALKDLIDAKISPDLISRCARIL